MPQALVPPFPDITPPLKVQQESTFANKAVGGPCTCGILLLYILHDQTQVDVYTAHVSTR